MNTTQVNPATPAVNTTDNLQSNSQGLWFISGTPHAPYQGSTRPGHTMPGPLGWLASLCTAVTLPSSSTRWRGVHPPTVLSKRPASRRLPSHSEHKQPHTCIYLLAQRVHCTACQLSTVCGASRCAVGWASVSTCAFAPSCTQRSLRQLPEI